MRKLAFALIALITISTQAQEMKERKSKSERKEMFKDLSAEEAAALKTKKMTLHLDLTASQQSKINELNLEIAKERILKRAEREKNKGQERAKLSKEERLSKMNSRLDKKIEMKKRFKEILSEEQYEKWEKSTMKKSRKAKRKGMKRKEMKSKE
jgi:hypothetical protein